MTRVLALPFVALLVACSGSDDTENPVDSVDSGLVEAALDDTMTSDGASDAMPPSEAGDATSSDVADAPPKEGVFVAVGYGGHRATSKDGVTWEHDQTDVPMGGDDEFLLRDVGFGGGVFSAVGWHVKTSSDAAAWTDHGKMGQWLGGLAYGKSKWVAAGGYGRRAWSDDGFTWHDADDGGLHGAYRGLGFGGGHWVGVGDGGRRSWTDDGVTWHEGTGDGATSLGEIAFGGGTFVAIGGKTALRSTDGGATWSAATKAPTADLEGIVHDGKRFVAVGSGHAFASTDGMNWDEISSSAGGGALAYGNGWYVAAGWGGAVFRSKDGATWTKSATLSSDDSFARVRFFTP